MNSRLTALERAFQLAKSGGPKTINDIKRELAKEHYSPVAIRMTWTALPITSVGAFRLWGLGAFNSLAGSIILTVHVWHRGDKWQFFLGDSPPPWRFWEWFPF
jgi:hypothetical protein